MDPFMPGEIPMMVLRYLAANHCVGTAMKLIEEMPRIRDFIPAKPDNVSDIGYLKHLMRTSKSQGLKDVLWDYGNSKILVEEMLDTDDDMNMMSSHNPESLLDKLKTVQGMIRSEASAPIPQPGPKVDKPMQPPIVKVDMSTNTLEYKCANCAARKENVSVKSDSSCQTDEYTAVELGVQKEIPILFYKTLLTDNNLHQKIAQTINEHINDESEGPDVFQKISSKAETEIDKFLVDFLQDIPDDCVSLQSDDGVSHDLQEPGSMEEIENNLKSMFYDAQSVVNTNSIIAVSSQNQVPPPVPESDERALHISTSPTSKYDGAPASPEQSEPGLRGIDDFINTNGSNTPKPYQRMQAVKRITPTPLSNTNVNPVFNTSIVVDKKTIGVGDKQTKVTVITANTQVPTQINRRSITPKVPGQSTITNNVTIRRVETQDNGQFFTSSTKAHHRGLERKILASTSSVSKRKGTPMKLTPEKAKQLDTNFLLIRSDTTDQNDITTKPNAESSKKSDSTMKKTPAPPSSVLRSVANPAPGNGHPFSLSENSSQDVTPMQPPPKVDSMSASSLKIMSPHALQRLIASANKICGNTSSVAANFLNKKKSFSTPRKRKHVRSLSFTTPPSLKNVSDKNLQANVGPETSLKRKAEDDLNSIDFKSKKRLNWPDSDKKKESIALETVKGSSGTLSIASKMNKEIGDVMSEGSKKQSANANSSTNNDVHNTIVSVDAPVKASSMPTIMEESMNSADVGVMSGTPSQTPNSSSKHVPATIGRDLVSQQQIVYLGRPVSSTENLTVFSEPLLLQDGSTFINYFQIDPLTNARIPIPIISSEGLQQSGLLSHGQFSQQTVPLTLNYTTEESLQSSSVIELQGCQLSSQDSMSQMVSLRPTITEQPSRQISIESAPSGPIVISEPVKTPTVTTLEINEADVNNTRTHASNSYPAQIETQVERDENAFNVTQAKVIPDKPVEKLSRRRSQQKKEVVQDKPPLPPPARKRERRTRGKKKTPSPPPKETLTKDLSDDEEEVVEVKRGSKGRGRGKPKAEKTKKPKITLKIKDLFGDSPLSKAMEPSTSKQIAGNLDKNPMDIMKGQETDNQKVHLATRRSPRKHNSTAQTETEKTPFKKVTFDTKTFGSGDVDIINADHRTAKTGVQNISVSQSSSIQNTTQQLQHQDPVVFSILPAPLGFPEPTPIKNFAQSGCLNISELTCNTGPLITPFKSTDPPAALNETHFTLPPTPRVIVDDNDSNSAHSLKLTFEGLYPSNLLTSTPLKPGVPRTPGKGSSSSNSQSPVQTVKGIGPLNIRGPSQNVKQDCRHPSVSQVMGGRPTPILTAARMPLIQRVQTQPAQPLTPRTAQVAADLDLSASPEKDKSDGEISSSDEEENEKEKTEWRLSSKKSTGKGNVPISLPEQHPREPARSQVIPAASNNRVQQLRNHPTTKSISPLQPHISVTLSPNIDRTKGIHFQVGRHRESRFLTMSKEEAAVYSLVNLSSMGRKSDERRFESSNPSIPRPAKPSRSVVPIQHQPNPTNENRNEVRPVSGEGTTNYLYSLVKAAQKKKEASRKS